MACPVAVPSCGHARSNHGATQVAAARRYAPSPDTISTSAACRDAPHCRPANQNMAMLPRGIGFADEIREIVARSNRVSVGTRVTCRAGAIEFARSNP